MTNKLSQHFAVLSGELCNILFAKDYNQAKVNILIDELNAKPYKGELFVQKQDAVALVTAVCLNIGPANECIAAKASHLITNVITKQNLQIPIDLVWKVMLWNIQCMKTCSDVMLPDLLHNIHLILQSYSQAALKFTDDFIGQQGLLLKLIDKENGTNPLQTTLLSLKCICSIISECDDKNEQEIITTELKNKISQVVINFLMKGWSKSHDEFLYCKVVIAALRVLTQLYFNGLNLVIPLPEVMGICRYYVLYGLLNLGNKPEKILPAQQTIAPTPTSLNNKGGRKQKLRKQRNNAVENLKKEIPVSDNSLLKDAGKFENNSAYKPTNHSYFEVQRNKNIWPLTSDSDMSDVESSRKAKFHALKSRVRQSSSNLLLVLIKVIEKRDMFGYWWALLPDSPDVDKWTSDEAAKKTLAYCAVHDPVASSRAAALSVVLSLLTGSRMYLSQAETSKKTTSFIPFSVSLGYIITCMHKVLVGILDNERINSVTLVGLKCCAALVQATPYHKMDEGLLTELVRASRKFLIHRDYTLQVGALITMGCILSVDPKVDEITRAIEKDTGAPRSKKEPTPNSDDDECEEFEEGYSDDEMFVATEKQSPAEVEKKYCFKTWILDICFKNLGWTFRGDEIVRCKPSVIPVMLESLQVLCALSFQYHVEFVMRHLGLLVEVLQELLAHQNQDVVLQAARTVSIDADALQKMEQAGESQPLAECIEMWEKLLPPLSSVLQCPDNAPAKATVCDCIANIGERTLKELPRHLQMLCCTLLVGSCCDEEPNVRTAAVRALAMAVMYRTLREDICFVSDCGENILRVLNEPLLTVRAKAAWALGNLSDALVLNREERQDEIDDDLLQRLLEVSIHCAADNNKVKMSVTRSLGNLLRLIKDENLYRQSQLKPLCETAIQKLLDCAYKVTNMKVRWNACYAIGNAMKNDSLFTCFVDWQRQVFPSLCILSQDCENLKVRINAATALRAPRSRQQYGDQYGVMWRGILAAIDNAAIVEDYTEFKHRDNLIEQLAMTLAHLSCLLKSSDLSDILDPLTFHFDSTKTLLTQLCQRLPPENESCQRILDAAKYLTGELTATTETQQCALGMLQEIFIWDY